MRWWQGLDRYFPSSLHNKNAKQFNESVAMYTFSYICLGLPLAHSGQSACGNCQTGLRQYMLSGKHIFVGMHRRNFAGALFLIVNKNAQAKYQRVTFTSGLDYLVPTCICIYIYTHT